MTISKTVVLAILLLMVGAHPQNAAAAGIVADHISAAHFDQIPHAYIQQAQENLRIFYGHTSHGSQLLYGLSILHDSSAVYDYNNGDILPIAEYFNDLGTEGETFWMGITRDRLNTPGNSDNLVIWSWCGGVTWNTEAGIQTYLDSMSQLEAEYPGVTFVYMTGHLDLAWPENLHARNDQIRSWCAANGKVLYDFADVESFDPLGNDYSQTNSDACEWCYDYCASHYCIWCGDGCSHSHCFNCYLKAKAFWWLLARLAGWDGTVGVIDQKQDLVPDNPLQIRNYPNPFNPRTNIEFVLERGCQVRLEVFNLAGQRVRTLTDRRMSMGRHEVSWDGRLSDGTAASSGVYLYRLEANDHIETRKMMLLR